MAVDPLVASDPLNRVPLFPLKTVLFPGSRLHLRIFEQRYLAMAKTCLAGEKPFGVCLITQGDEVAATSAGASLEFAATGTLATIRTWDMPQLGILNVMAEGATRIKVCSHETQADGLVVGQVSPIAPEAAIALPARHRALAELLTLLIARMDPQHLAQTRAYQDASWVGFRLAELLPLPLALKQRLLEENDADARLSALQTFIGQRGLV